MPQKRINIGKTARLPANKENPFIPPVLSELIAIMDRYNKVNLNAHLKRQIAIRLSTSADYIETCIHRFVKQGFILKVANSSYVINPQGSFKCSNIEFLGLQKEYDKILKVIEVNRGMQESPMVQQAKKILRRESKKPKPPEEEDE